MRRQGEPGRDPIVLFLSLAACRSRRGRSTSSSLMEPASSQMSSRTANTSARLPRRAVVLALLLACKPVLAQASASEAEVKAAYLHKFAGFVEWPADRFASASSPYVVAVAGDEAVLEELRRIARGRLVQGRPVAVVPAAVGDVPRDANVLFIGRAAMRDAPALVADARNDHVLVVTEAPSGLAAGATLNFVQQDGRVRFEASLAAARASDLRLSSRLLGVATRVVEAQP